MSRIPAFGSFTPALQQSQSKGGDFRDVDMSSFLNLMIAELQNQDPLNPMENSELIQQISQIREIGATNKLTDTLNAVMHGQQIATAGTLIGKEIVALSDKAENVTGVVERVSVERDPKDDSKFALRVHVGNQSVRLTNIREIKS
jgi:flagellar basal-body rod modification protein FlgD